MSDAGQVKAGSPRRKVISRHVCGGASEAQDAGTGGAYPRVIHAGDLPGVGQLVDAEVEVGAGLGAQGGFEVHGTAVSVWNVEPGLAPQ